MAVLPLNIIKVMFSEKALLNFLRDVNIMNYQIEISFNKNITNRQGFESVEQRLELALHAAFGEIKKVQNDDVQVTKVNNIITINSNSPIFGIKQVENLAKNLFFDQHGELLPEYQNVVAREI